MKTINTYVLPAYWAPALINGDFSGLLENEETEIHIWLVKNGQPDFVECSEESFFCYKNDANNIGCDCFEYKAFN
jgi:hypothetical protein